MIQASASALLFRGAAMAASVDLSGWEANGDQGNLVVLADNDSVVQTVNSSQSAFFHNNANSQGLALSGKIKVQTTSDDEFMGFILGYKEDASAYYILIG